MSFMKGPNSNIGCSEGCCIYIVFFWALSQYSRVTGFWYCTGILCCQLKCAFASLPTVWAVRHVPQGLSCLFPFGHLLQPWDFHDGYLKVLKLCVLVQFIILSDNYHLSLPATCALCMFRVGCPDWGFLFFFSQSLQTNASTAPPIRPWHSPSTSFPVYC